MRGVAFGAPEEPCERPAVGTIADQVIAQPLTLDATAQGTAFAFDSMHRTSTQQFGRMRLHTLLLCLSRFTAVRPPHRSHAVVPFHLRHAHPKIRVPLPMSQPLGFQMLGIAFPGPDGIQATPV